MCESANRRSFLTTSRHLAAVFPLLCCWIGLGTPGRSAEGAEGSGWTDLAGLLVSSDGSRTRGREAGSGDGGSGDGGSVIVFFDGERGRNESGALYWWDGKRIVDSTGSAVDADGQAYGSDPLLPNEKAIRAFEHPARDLPLRSSTGYPDWYLLRRGQVHDTFGASLVGGRSIDEPMVVAAYGPEADGRAVVKPASGRSPISGHNRGAKVSRFHQVVSGLELHCGVSRLGMHKDCTSPGKPGVPTLLIEDCKIVNGQMNYLPVQTTMRRSVSAFRWSDRGHNQGYFTSDFFAAPLFEEVIFYKNGYKTEPRSDPDPRRTIFDRNIYQGGGARMGHTYRNIISADGGSGGPQMRLGGLIENSLIIEGYWYSSTSSNKAVNAWLTEGGQAGCSAIVRDNVQFVFAYPSPADPDAAGRSDTRAHPGWGYTIQGASFGALIERNIISGAMLTDDLGFGEHARAAALKFALRPSEYQDGETYTAQRCTMRGNIGYRLRDGLALEGSWRGATGHVAEDNVFVAGRAVTARVEDLASAEQLTVRGNRFYSSEGPTAEAWIGQGNTLAPYGDAARKETWPDPDRTLKRYVEEVLELTLLDWSDDPWLSPEEKAKGAQSGKPYDPMGLKTFMAVATNMRRGGRDRIPDSGKPSWRGDYPWDTRFTGQAVVNWVRQGFGLDAVGD